MVLPGLNCDQHAGHHAESHHAGLIMPTGLNPVPLGLSWNHRLMETRLVAVNMLRILPLWGLPSLRLRRGQRSPAAAHCSGESEGWENTRPQQPGWLETLVCRVKWTPQWAGGRGGPCEREPPGMWPQKSGRGLGSSGCRSGIFRTVRDVMAGK